ncbi:Similar to Phosphatidylinositol 4,5-bisphosphate-binding protein SLM1; acc. no. P40485 [Pyronema omphalodes CBS 100304]|uniref:Similar to Phosphatidylinositol 4,5-bisphosphate-binding protein SLM1 acc. no. P40485 n=1 Tax=Pyronema omphalodes (strain CBS 100304) TaxID=1076935 RepID=U4LBH3_PYROM|nr:Similar to Phosphatidylinositol 4,5-bisphosphate-binding protein SLM1; acc. no. P40485 [Pyronema omphalodes CBS 100304]
MAAFPPPGERFTEDFSSLHQYQPATNMDPETGAPTTDRNILQHPNTENLSPQAPNPNTIIPQRSDTVASRTSRAAQDPQAEEAPQRSGTLKKKNSVKRSGSRKSKPGSIRSIKMEQQEQLDVNSAFYTPVPTNNSPTELLVNRFQAWRKVLKDFITYFREVQAQYESRARGIAKVTQSLHTTSSTSEFAPHGGILEVNNVLRDFHKEATINSEHAAKIERDIINSLNGLRSDLNLKLKEIKALSPDFKNNVEKEKEGTKKEIQKLQEVIRAFEENQGNGGKDPYIHKLAVERQLRRQLQEENYLHRAYLNIESSGRELEKLIVLEIQKCYSVYISILSRDGQELLDLSSRLTTTTLQLPPDYEWSHFITRSSAGGTGGLVDPSIPLRSLSSITYPGYQHPLLTEVRSGMLERKSKYLKSFTPAWYVLSPTYLHEFKSPDRVRDPNPVMSLYLPESSLGKYSDPAAVSHKFALKAKQPGSLHRGHNWVFRAETHQMMLEWYEAIKKLIEVRGKEREDYVATNNTRMRSVSGAGSVDSQEDLQDEEDEQPYSAQASDLAPVEEIEEEKQRPKRPEGGNSPAIL